MNGVAFLENRDFAEACQSLELFPSGPMADPITEITCEAFAARFRLQDDISPLFPYINAVASRARFYDQPVYINFVFERRLCGFYGREGAFAPIDDMVQALEFLTKLLDFLADISRKRGDIIPSRKRFSPSSPLDIYRLLPGSNCRLCGYATCLAFAAALSRQYTSFVNCPHLRRPMEERATFPVYDRQGNVVETVSIAIDSGRLQQKLYIGEARILDLQSQLQAREHDHGTTADFPAANAALQEPLTGREIDVLRLMARGGTNREIAADLRISRHTVKSHVTHIFQKIGVNDRAQAAAWGALHGVLW